MQVRVALLAKFERGAIWPSAHRILAAVEAFFMMAGCFIEHNFKLP
jgi:hypothetical protein